MSDDEYAYLRDGFNANKLRKDQLRNVLLTHDVEFSSSMLKPELVGLFEKEIVPRRAELRKKFVDVVASASNIENATPPAGKESRNQRDASAEPEPARSPLLRPRSRSPRRAVSKAKQEPVEPDTKPLTLKPGSTPKLAPPPVEFAAPPKSPSSPRRRRATRKVETPSADLEPLKVPDVNDITIKSNRSPQKKRPAESEDGDESFSSNNIFQSGGHQAKKARLDFSNSPSNSLSLPGSELPQDLAELDHLLPIADNTNIDAIPFDDNFVADLNAEMARYDDQDLMFLDFPDSLEFEQKPDTAAIPKTDEGKAGKSDKVEPKKPKKKEVAPAAERPAKLSKAPTNPVPAAESKKESSSSKIPPKAKAKANSPSLSSLPETATPKASVARHTENTPANRRRGFLPSLSELNVSQAFAEQLEPFMAATPAPTPRSATPRYDTSRSPTPLANTTNLNAPVASATESDSIDLKDAEKVAAEDIHQVVEALPSPRLPRFRIRVRVPNFRAPRIKISLLRAIAGNVMVLLSTLFSISMLVLAGAVFKWFRGAYESADFCGVGTHTAHVYPQWTLVDTGSSALTHFQGLMRESMDEVWPECVQCPENAHCYQNRVVLCDTGYIQTQHSLAWTGVWPFVAKCVPDWEAQRKLCVLSERAAVHLRQKRSDVLCASGDVPTTEEDIAQASALSTNQLRSKLLAEKSDLMSEEDFDDLWQQVVDLLPSQFSDVYVVSDPFQIISSFETIREDDNNIPDNQMLTNTQTLSGDGPSEADASSSSQELDTSSSGSLADHVMWLASNSDELMPFNCRITRHLWVWINENRSSLIKAGVFLTLALVSSLKVTSWLNRRRRHEKMVDAFVTQIKAQRALATQDASGKTLPYLRTTELRRQVPRAEWPRIQVEVESVEEVRARQIEVHGEIMRIWEWTS